MAQNFDVIIVGAGPGGYVAAIKAAQLGFKTACIEKRETLGGTCLNVGCIPSKALLQSSEKFHAAQHSLSDHGVELSSVKLNLKTMLGRKDKVVSDLTKGIDFLFKKNKVTSLFGRASFVNPTTLSVTLNKGGTEEITGKHIIIATGSESASLPNVAFDEKVIVSSTGALSLPKVPKHMVVIGGGYIGLELGSVWQRLGAEVTVVEYLNRIVPSMDDEVAQALQKILTKQGLTFKLGYKVAKIETVKAGAKLTLEPAAGGKAETLEADVVLVSIGRKPNTDGLALDKAGIKTDDKGRIPVNANYETVVKGIYAIGDVIAGPMLAHKAEEEGVVLVEQLAGHKVAVNYDAIPGVIYTAPEVASVGKTEEELKKAGVSYKVGKFPFSANSRARAIGENDGFVKLLADAKTDKLLGAHIIGHEAGTMIAELALAMEYSATSEDVARTCHAHPTLNEAIKEAALAVFDKPIHI